MITMTADDRSIESLARMQVQALPLYAPDVAPCAVDVSDNINLWGAPPAALRALAGASPAQPSRYPSLYSAPLRDAVLRYVGLSGASDVGIVTGCGSDDVLDAAMRAFGNAGDEIAFAAPTFAMIPIFGRLNGMTPVALPMTSTYDVDPQQLVDRRAKITYLCTPNNPTATALSREAVEYVAANAAGIVIIDEAYAEFAPETFVSLAAEHERVLVTRTFSKAFGLAGLRIGVGIGSESLVDLVTRARGPFKVNALAEAAALAALGNGPDALGWVSRHATLAVEVRERLVVELRSLGLEPLPSAANFVFVPTARAQSLARAMRDRGVLARALSGLERDLPALRVSQGHALRIGVGAWEMMETVLDSLREALTCA
jgi:histidinol-phosphate aminotransferase